MNVSYLKQEQNERVSVIYEETPRKVCFFVHVKPTANNVLLA